MKLNEYQEATNRTAPDLEKKQRIDNYIYGLNGEVGEMTDLLKKWRFHDHGISAGELLHEFGDVLWYMTRLASEFDFTLDMVAKANIEKLKRRYPQGFTTDDSKNRGDE